MTITAADSDLDFDAEARAEPTGSPIVYHILIFAALLAVWELSSRMGWADELTFPAPSAIAVSLARIYVVQGNIWWNMLVTLTEAVAGFLLGSGIGIGLAVAAALSETFRRYIKPYIVVLQITPRVAIAPLIIAWLGFGWSPKIAVAALICFFAPFVNTLTGLLTVDDEARDMFRSLGASKAQIFWKLLLPNAMPIIMAGLKLAAASALAGAIVGEYVSSNQGVGVLILRYTHALNMPSAFACLLTLTAAGFLFFRTMDAADRNIVFWRDDARMTKVGRKRALNWRAS